MRPVIAILAAPPLLVSAQGAKKAGPPLRTSVCDVGNLGVQPRNPGAAPESHDTFAHVLIFTSGMGRANLGGEIVTGPDGKKIVRGGDRRKVAIGEVYHLSTAAQSDRNFLSSPGVPKRRVGCGKTACGGDALRR